jgi:ABC-type uncharacterized transport system involved in gliding motility auxiliary subunit
VRGSQGILGVLGLILLFFGGTAFALTREIGLFVGLNLVFGLFALISYLASGRERVTTFLGERSTKYGANAILYSVLFTGIIAMGNFIAVRYNWRWDASEAKVFSLSPQSTQVVRDLEKELELLAFVEGGSNAPLADLLQSYAYESDRVSFQMIDPDRRPELAERYSIQSYDTVRVAYGDQSSLVTEPSEEKLTNAILKISQAEQKTVCFVEGHGEPDPDEVEDPRGYGQLKAALENENYVTRKLLLATLQEPPLECSLLVVAAGEKPWLEGEIALLEAYLDGGGRSLFLFSAKRPTQLAPVLAKRGIAVGEDIVVDQVVRLFQGPALGVDPIANTYGEHPITEGFDQRTIFPVTRTVEAAATMPETVVATELVKTGATSWAEQDVAGVFERGEAQRDDEADRKGPVAVAVAATLGPAGAVDEGEDADESEGEADAAGSEEESNRIVVFGSSELADNQNLSSFYNRDLVLNAIGWTVGEEDLVTVRPRGMRVSRVQLTADEVSTIFYLSVLGLPELLLLLGVVVSLRRRGG